MFTMELTKFVEFANQLEGAFVRGLYDECHTLLQAIEEQFGLTIWFIKKNLLILQQSKGLEAQKNYLKTVRDQGLIRGFAPYIAYHVSTRNEPTVSATHFLTRFAEQLAEIRLKTDVSDYLRYHIAPEPELSEIAISNVLRHEGVGTVIDYYEAFVVAIRAAIACAHTKMYPSIRIALGRLHCIRDERLSAAIAVLGIPSQERILDTSIAAFDARMRGDHAACIRLVTSVGVPDFDVLECGARSLAANASQIPKDIASPGWIVEKLAAVAEKTEAAGTASDELYKIALNATGAPWADQLVGFLQLEFPTRQTQTDAILRYATLGSHRLHPQRLRYIRPLGERDAHATNLEALVPGSIAAAYARSFVKGEPSTVPALCQDEALLMRVESAVARYEFGDGLAHTGPLLTHGTAYYRHNAIRLHAECLLQSGRIENLIEFICEHLLLAPHLHRVLPVSEAAQALTQSIRMNLASHIYLPIFLDFFSRHYGPGRDVERSCAFERFLRANSVARPSELNTSDWVKKVGLKTLVYFLRNVCVESVMDGCVLFKSSPDVINERVAVCRTLAELDPQNVEEYHADIRDLLRRLTLQKRRRQVDQSRIYVDLESVAHAVRPVVRADLERYISLAASGLAGDVPDVNKAIVRVRSGDKDALTQLELPVNEANTLLRSMIARIRDAFVFDTEHGLDGYLSVRIRHGTLSGHLRGRLEHARLVTQRDALSGKYKKNEYWIGRLGSNSRYATQLSEALNRFSESADAIISEISREWVQVRRPGHPRGALSFEFTTAVESIIAAEARMQGRVEDFVSTVIVNLYYLLADGLKVLREWIDTKAKPQFSRALSRLQADVERQLPSGSMPDLIDQIRVVRTEMQMALDRIKDWFRVNQSYGGEPFDVGDAVEIGVTSVKAISRDFTVTVNEESGNFAPVLGPQLMPLVDIIFIMLENVVRHSDVGDAPQASVLISQTENSLTLTVENEVLSPTEKHHERLETIRRALRASEYMHSVSLEGGTGFFKIAKIITRDLAGTPDITFGYKSHNMFIAKVTVPVTRTAMATVLSGSGCPPSSAQGTELDSASESL